MNEELVAHLRAKYPGLGERQLVRLARIEESGSKVKAPAYSYALTTAVLPKPTKASVSSIKLCIVDDPDCEACQ